MSFDDKNKGDVLKTAPGIKSNTKSMFDTQIKKPKKADFEHKVDEIEKSKMNYVNKSIDIFKQLNQILNDKTLVENKTYINTSFENEVLNSFIVLITDINTDENQTESEGSVMAIGYLLKTLFSQRDRLNQLEYEIVKIKQNQKSDL